MHQIFEFSAQLEPVEGSGGLSARIVPFGVTVPYAGADIRFEAGGLTLPDAVPLTVDHGESVLDRIGVLERFAETDQGAFAEFKISDTPNGRAVRTLLQDGALGDVSIGVSEFSVDDGVMSGTLDHVSVVSHGRFSQGSTPAQVLSVHSQQEEGPPMAETEEAAVVAEHDDTVPVAEFTALEGRIETLSAQLAEVADHVADNPTDDGAAEFAGITEDHLTLALEQAMDSKANFALADVVSDGTPPNDASGLTPDFYWSAGLQQSVRQWRPSFNAAGTGPWNSYGDAIQTAKVTQDVAVGSGTAQKVEVTSQALHVIPVSFPNVWHSGAVDVAYQIMEQSSPSVRSVIQRSFMKVYAKATNVDLVAKYAAAANATGAVLQTDTYVNLITDLRTTGVLIRDNSNDMIGNMVGVTTAQYTAILTLVDADGRRITATVNPTNGDGSASLLSEAVQLGGFTIYEDPDLANAIQFNSETLMKHEKPPVELSVTNVANAGYDVGVIGGTTVSYWDEGIYKYTV